MHDFGAVTVAEHRFDLATVAPDQSTYLGHRILTEAACHGAVGIIHDLHQVATLELGGGVDPFSDSVTGQSLAMAYSVPEPQSLAWLSLAGVLLRRRRGATRG